MFNSKGEVIGINSVKYVSAYAERMGYAIPINTAIPILNELINYEEVNEEDIQSVRDAADSCPTSAIETE